MEHVGYDDWNGGTDFYVLSLYVTDSLYAQLGTDARSVIESHMKDKTGELVGHWSGYKLSGVRVLPEPLRRSGLAAQGACVAPSWSDESGPRPIYEHRPTRKDGLFFRSSSAEVRLYHALKTLGISFAPLPVFIRGGAQYRRIEPD